MKVPRPVELDGVRVSLGGNPVLRGVDLAVRRGEILALLGRSGAGKSTLLRLVNRLQEADAGEVRVEGRPVGAWDPIELRRRTGYVIQEIGLFPHRTVAENVATVPRLLGWPETRRAERTGALLELVGLDPDAATGRYPRELSGGQRQRVGVARALAADPPLLLCDEPFGAVDPVTRGQLRAEFGALVRRLGKTVLFVTHDVAEAVELGDRVALLDGGRIVFLDTPAAFRGSGEPVVAAFRDAARMDR